jgi:hypothetical protein
VATIQVNEISMLSDAELDAVGGGSFNWNYASLTQVNAVGVNQSNQAVNIQTNQSGVCVSVSLSNCQT